MWVERHIVVMFGVGPVFALCIHEKREYNNVCAASLQL